MQPKHLPYRIDPEANRMHFYETLWKNRGLELLLKHCPPENKSLLDFGCGRGESIQIFGDAGVQVTGTDTDPECVRLSSEHGKSVVLNPENPVGQFGEKSFGVITCFHVLEHVENPSEVLRSIAAIARDYVVLAVPNLRYLHRLSERQFDLAHVNEGHLQSWDHWHLRNLAERHCGLELVEWGADATILPCLSNLSEKLLGQRNTIRLETGPFRRLFPFHCISVIGLFRVKKSTPSDAA